MIQLFESWPNGNCVFHATKFHKPVKPDTILLKQTLTLLYLES